MCFSKDDAKRLISALDTVLDEIEQAEGLVSEAVTMDAGHGTNNNNGNHGYDSDLHLNKVGPGYTSPAKRGSKGLKAGSADLGYSDTKKQKVRN